MKKRSYINTETGEIKEFKKDKQPEGWEYLPPMERWVDKDGKFHLRVHFDDSTVEIIEQDEPIEGEVVENGDKNSD